MNLFKKKPDDIQQYVKAGASARKNQEKYNKTGKKKFQERARQDRDRKKALGMKISNPGTTVENNNLEINNSFNKSKSIGVSVPVTTKVVKQSKNKTSKKK